MSRRTRLIFSLMLTIAAGAMLVGTLMATSAGDTATAYTLFVACMAVTVWAVVVLWDASRG